MVNKKNNWVLLLACSLILSIVAGTALRYAGIDKMLVDLAYVFSQMLLFVCLVWLFNEHEKQQYIAIAVCSIILAVNFSLISPSSLDYIFVWISRIILVLFASLVYFKRIRE